MAEKWGKIEGFLLGSVTVQCCQLSIFFTDGKII